MGRVAECCTVCFRIKPDKVILCVNVFIGTIGFILAVVGLIFLATYAGAGDELLSQGAYAIFIVVGILTMLLTYLACSGAHEPRSKPNMLFCYWCITTVLLGLNIVGFIFFKVFIKGIANSGGDGQIATVIEIQVAKDFNDYVLSTYTACCTGCDITVPELSDQCDGGIFPGEFTEGAIYCNETILDPGDGSRPEDNGADCYYAEICSAQDLQEANSGNGIGIGCYAASDKIPSAPIRDDACAILESMELRKFGNRPLVGPVSNDYSCGRGIPKVYQQNFIDYFERIYLRIAIPWGILMTLLSAAWLGALVLIVCPTWGSGSKGEGGTAS